jgi:hypothetical protein
VSAGFETQLLCGNNLVRLGVASRHVSCFGIKRRSVVSVLVCLPQLGVYEKVSDGREERGGEDLQVGEEDDIKIIPAPLLAPAHRPGWARLKAPQCLPAPSKYLTTGAMPPAPHKI